MMPYDLIQSSKQPSHAVSLGRKQNRWSWIHAFGPSWSVSSQTFNPCQRVERWIPSFGWLLRHPFSEVEIMFASSWKVMLLWTWLFSNVFCMHSMHMECKLHTTSNSGLGYWPLIGVSCKMSHSCYSCSFLQLQLYLFVSMFFARLTICCPQLDDFRGAGNPKGQCHRLDRWR